MQRLTLRGLESARGFLQAKLAERVQIRYTPVLHFELDQGVKRSIEASRLLREVLPQSGESETHEDDAQDGLVDDQPGADSGSDEVGSDEVGHDEPATGPPAKALATDEDQDHLPADRQP
jgi:ribosome-binding factor A